MPLLLFWTCTHFSAPSTASPPHVASSLPSFPDWNQPEQLCLPGLFSIALVYMPSLWVCESSH